MIKLTRAEYVSHSEGKATYRATEPVWVAPAAIETMAFVGGATEIGFAHRGFAVMETPEEIMAMPEMQRHMNPLMQVSATGPVLYGRQK
jgi:hypothetical protein